MRDSQITASDGTGPAIAVIAGVNYYAYRRLEDIHLVGLLRIIRGLSAQKEYRIDSMAAPLTLDIAGSDFSAMERRQVYTGRLSVSWRYMIGRGGLSLLRGSMVSNVVVTLRYRNDGANAALSCFDPADVGDASNLICADVRIPIVIGSQSCEARLTAKSNFPFRNGPQADPASFAIRRATFDTNCLG